MEGIIGETNESPALVNGVQCRCLVDTGSQVTTISHAFYKKHLGSTPIMPLGDLLRIEGAAGQSVPFLGCVAVELSFPREVDGCGGTRPVLALVVKNTDYNKKVPLVVGTNVIKICKEDCEKEHGVQFLQKINLDRVWHLAYKFLTISKNPSVKNGVVGHVKAANSSPLCVKGGQCLTVWGKVVMPKNVNVSQLMVVGKGRSTLANSLVVSPAVVSLADMQDGKVPVLVRNTSLRDCNISPRVTLGTLEGVTWVGTPGELRATSLAAQQGSKKQERVDPLIDSDDKNQKIDLSGSMLTEDQTKLAQEFLTNWTHVFSHSNADLGHA